MKGFGVTWQGLLDLEIDLRHLPADLAAEAADLVQQTAERTQRALVQAYPRGKTGGLRQGVSLVVKRSPFGIYTQLRSRAPHAHFYEFGTEPRRYVTRRGRVHRTGAMRTPAARGLEGLVAVTLRERAPLRAALAALLTRAGFRVSA